MDPRGSDGAALRRRRVRRAAARTAAPALALSGERGHGAGAAQRHAEPGDDRGACGAGVARVAHGVAAVAVRAVARTDRVSFRYPPLVDRMAARALHLGGHPAAMGRACDHAVRADRPLGRYPRAGGLRIPLGRSRVPAGGRGPAHHPDRRPRARDRPRPARRAAPGGRAAVRHAAGRHGGELGRDRGAARGLLPGAADPGGAGRGGGDLPREPRGVVEAGSSPAVAHEHRGGAPDVPLRLARAARRPAYRPPAARGGPRGGGLQHAGRAAGALRRAGAATLGQRHHGADGIACGRHAGRVRDRRAAAVGGRRLEPDRRRGER